MNMAHLPPFDTQFCVVSEQAIPNLTPLLDSRLRPSTKRVVLFVTQRMERQAGWLEQILKRRGIETKRVPLNEKAEYPQLVKTFQEQLDKFPCAILNATGGKKNMTVAAHSVFVRARRPVFYVETDNTLHWLMEEHHQPPFPLEATLDLETLFNAYGYAISEKQNDIASNLLSFAKAVIAKPEQYAQAITDLSFKNQGQEKIITSKTKGNLDTHQVDLLKLAQQHKLVTELDGSWICTNAAAKFISGEWLELYVQAVLRNKLKIANVLRGIRITRIDKGADGSLEHTITNEIDVAFTKNNQLYLIECKALSSTKNPNAKNKSMQDFIYTLDAIKKSGGLNTKAALVVWGAELGSGSRKRAEEYKIKVFTRNELHNFEAALLAWINQR